MSEMALEFDSTHPFFKALTEKMSGTASGAYPKIIAGICIEGVIAPVVLNQWEMKQGWDGITLSTYWTLLQPPK